MRRLKLDEMFCPQCASAVPMVAKVCRHCRYEFTPDDLERAKENHSRAGQLTFLGCLGAVLIIGSCVAIMNRPKNIDEITAPLAFSEPAAPYIRSGPPIIMPDAIMLMTPKSYPGMFSRVGRKAFKRANDLTPEAAHRIASMEGCDALEMIGVSGQSTQTSIQWFGDCANGFRGTVFESELRH